MATTNFIDYVRIFCRSGAGGPGSAHLHRDKRTAKGGPDGGNGGRGGHVILRGDRNYWTLIHLKYQRHIFAGDGESGSGNLCTGADGEDKVIDVPLGTVARDADTGEVVCEITADGETPSGDGSYTLCLTEGRNIVKLVSDAGAEYQVLSAKPVSYTVTNNTTPGGTYLPGDEVSVRFATLYHPCNKLAGVYNMTANIQYSDGTSTYSNKGSQYTFASTEAAQTLTLTIPAGWPLGTDFTLAQGALYASGFGDPYGNHRAITYDEGKDVNFTAGKRTAYFGSLPAISLPVGQPLSTGLPAPTLQVHAWPNPFTDYLVVRTEAAQRATLYDLAGKAVLTTKLQSGDNRIDTSTLPHGTYVLRCNGATAKVVK